MNVNVFVMRVDGALQAEMLLLPIVPRAPIPDKYRVDWEYFATVDTGDGMFVDIDALAIDIEIAASGFAVVIPTLPNRP
ncbi:MAG: hypothetical protein ACOH2N_00135 [Devosia sp.]